MSTPIEFHLPTVTSTNDYAKELLETYPYVFVSAVHQTAGRGRKGREWVGDPGSNVYVSVGVRHPDPEGPEELASYMARGALAMIDTLRSMAPNTRFRLKYPNDVQAHTGEVWAKIGGTLVEHLYQGEHCLTSVIGMGLNVQQMTFPETINQPCTSLQLLGVTVDVSELIQALKRRVSDIRMLPWPSIHARWVAELDIVGKHVRLSGSNDDWIVSKVHTDGRLTARNTTSNHERTITDGDSVRYHDRDQ